MNCKPGDLAFVTSEMEPSWLGRIVSVVRQFDHDSWITDPTPRGYIAVADEALRPIRDQPGDDETLTWAGKPDELPADVIREVTACN